MSEKKNTSYKDPLRSSFNRHPQDTLMNWEFVVCLFCFFLSRPALQVSIHADSVVAVVIFLIKKKGKLIPSGVFNLQ